MNVNVTFEYDAETYQQLHQLYEQKLLEQQKQQNKASPKPIARPTPRQRKFRKMRAIYGY